MESLKDILINLLSLEVDLPNYYRPTDGKNIIAQRKFPLEDISGFLLYREATEDISACVIVNPAYNNQQFIQKINWILAGACDLDGAYTWWENVEDLQKGDPDSPLFHYDSFAQFFLSWIAYQMMGHPLAHAAIANDTHILNQLQTTNIGKGFFNSIIGLSGESLGSLYYQIEGIDAGRFEEGDAIDMVLRFSICVRDASNNVGTAIIEVDSADIGGSIQSQLPQGVSIDISANRVSFFTEANRMCAITFLGGGVTGEVLGFSNQGTYITDTYGKIIGLNDINTDAQAGYRYLPMISGDVLRFEVEVKGYNVIGADNEVVWSKEATVFTISIEIE